MLCRWQHSREPSGADGARVSWSRCQERPETLHAAQTDVISARRHPARQEVRHGAEYQVCARQADHRAPAAGQKTTVIYRFAPIQRPFPFYHPTSFCAPAAGQKTTVIYRIAPIQRPFPFYYPTTFCAPAAGQKTTVIYRIAPIQRPFPFYHPTSFCAPAAGQKTTVIYRIAPIQRPFPFYYPTTFCAPAAGQKTTVIYRIVPIQRPFPFYHPATSIAHQQQVRKLPLYTVLFLFSAPFLFMTPQLPLHTSSRSENYS